MGAKRKRARSTKSDTVQHSKRLRCSATEDRSEEHIHHPTLRLYYKQISTLRDYLLFQLPRNSKKRRRRLETLGRNSTAQATKSKYSPITRSLNEGSPLESNVDAGRKEYLLARLLDQTVVCSVDQHLALDPAIYAQDFEAFSQQINPTAGSSAGGCASQSELIDFAVWLLFHRHYRTSHRPAHILCHGYQRTKEPLSASDDLCAVAGIPGIVSHYPNENVSILKSAEWNDVLSLLGKDGEKVMLDLIVRHGTFSVVENGKGNFLQLSGTPVTELAILEPSESVARPLQAKPEPAGGYKVLNIVQRIPHGPRSPASICFVRHRMFYARAALNAKGKVTFGLRHIHALNRYPDANNSIHTLRLLQYIFPREFGLHNVFTSVVDPKETIQAFMDYTLREMEIARKERGLQSKRAGGRRQRIPKRLCGRTVDLVQKLQGLHSRCSYLEMLKYYCPLKASKPTSIQSFSNGPGDEDAANFITQVPNHTQTSKSSTISSPDASPSFFDLATPHANVSAFCRAIVAKLIPNGFWGRDELGSENKGNIMRKIDRFVRLRMFEPMSLHMVSQGLSIKAIEWLVPLNISPAARAAQTDMRKRMDLFMEFLYYIFDSILIPLLRSNFHITESAVHQNHLFYFRHDVWRAMAEPAMTTIKLNLFKEIDTQKAKRLLDARTLGFSQIRLLPKATGVRPITNLRRRMTNLKNGRVVLGRSINSVVAPVFNILDFERKTRPCLIGSAMFSVGDMYPKLKDFTRRQGRTRGSFYFAKVDAQACFDTIPQREIIRLMGEIVSQDEYRIARHSEIKASNPFFHQGSEDATFKPARKFKSVARAASDFDQFAGTVEASLASGKKNTIFVDGIVQQPQKADKALDLLEEHVTRNVIKIGKKFFRQTSGIPQGSIVSSMLCNYFYAELEREQFHFLKHDESILLRLIDDFLLITTNQDHAKEFLQIMHDGVKKHGVSVNRTKSLANFDTMINGHKVPQQPQDKAFPYCGNMIDTKTLEITKDRDRRKETVLANALTVDPSRVPGKTFYRKTLNAFKIQTHKMFLDTSFNSASTVLSTLYQNFAETAMKCYRYAKSMPTSKRPSSGLVIGTICDLIDLAYVLSQGKHTGHGTDGYECTVSRCQMRWLAGRAFRHVLGQKQTGYRAVVAWLDGLMAGVHVGSRREVERLERIAREGDAIFEGYHF